MAGGSARELLAELAGTHNLSVDPDALIQDLPLGLQQRVEILKQLYRGAEILVLDEPTDVLTPQETEEFFEILQDLKTRGVTSILITHKLNEILAVTSQVAIIRRGKIVGQVATKDTNEQELADLMVGRAVSFQVDKASSQPGPPLLEVQGLSKGPRPQSPGRGIIDGAGGEIVGIAGIAGNGQTELLEVLAGISDFEDGQVKMHGKSCPL